MYQQQQQQQGMPNVNMYPPQQGQMYPQAHPQQFDQQQQLVMIPPPMVINTQNDNNYSNHANNAMCPTTIKCPHCQKVGTTNMSIKAGAHTYICCLILFFTTGCCCIPFCIDSCKDRVHQCQNCSAHVGVKEYKLF